MMHDSVREELEGSISTAPRVMASARSVAPPTPPPPPREIKLAPPPKRVETTGLVAPKTSPTLVEFQQKKPDWRLQLHEAVQNRRGQQMTATAAAPALAISNVEAINRPRREVPVVEVEDDRVKRAMQRIARSRETYRSSVPPDAREAAARAAAAAQLRKASLNLVRPVQSVNRVEPKEIAAPEPKLVSPLPGQRPAISMRRETSKLPPLDVFSEPETPATPIETAVAESVPQPVLMKRIEIKIDAAETSDRQNRVVTSTDIEDLAPFSMRFSSGLFDLIIGVFAALLILSPIAFAGGDWLNWVGVVTVGGTWATVQFLYMTISLGFYGKTFGMRLFALELVDAVENEYPTLRQAAVNSSVFILTLMVGGLGFLTALFNEERRALHDLLSGTILVREF